MRVYSELVVDSFLKEHRKTDPLRSGPDLSCEVNTGSYEHVVIYSQYREMVEEQPLSLHERRAIDEY